jgi:hypothetical protein
MSKITVEGLSATPWRQVFAMKRADVHARFYQSTVWPEFYKRVAIYPDGHTTTRYACDDEIVIGLHDIAEKMNAVDA